ncbi:phage distal tail protein [Senegalia massiliensis]|uniref:Siphovirus-type tail component C-terminal domain-containing protein n=1 Tax=Senegalia massiliensis TaxID=1720316 RepID=A0A845R2Y6_9CLOT|nr:hypothetical protein [Senegalia massiliensis]NBI08056.1 hypothetical protein [Senegalia massiliensis]
MYINNKDITEYNAKLLNRIIYPSETTINNEWNDNSLEPIIDEKVKRKYKRVLIEIEFQGTPEEIEMNKSNLLKDISIATIKFKSLLNFYRGSMVNNDIKNKVNGFEVISIEMKVIEEEQEKTINFNKSNDLTIFVGGNDTTPAIVEITPSIDVASVNITGFGEDITLNNLTIDNTVILDGVKGLITENGENKFLDYDSWGFPRLEPGENNISVDNDTLDIIIKYKPRWI